MTAQQIRKTKFEHDDGAWESAHWLQEIAAQLAEMNERNAMLSDFVRKEAKEVEKLARADPHFNPRKRKRNGSPGPNTS